MMYLGTDDRPADNRTSIDHQALYRRLMACTTERGGNAPFFAQMLASWLSDKSALPRYMGLEEPQFREMMAVHFPGFCDIALATRRNIEPERASELEDVLKLLLDHRSNQGEEEVWIARIVATGCMGSEHLWSDLGLFERRVLGQMLLHNFRPLAEQNNNNMRWKKFFYRQLCAREGFILCRSPSCETCTEYAVCFAPQEA
ncbi:nitrogen fixation protein NifQ [uncultured Cohaesibacter sp.]|uniref:nitrogen fixation protein NifQ n=1 Tax=uncultured Cohaesibacter sp. TaxID=1002546 RepID=UPI0029C830D3|nr:nitrogen fixation protein NifQ [uncultured Cohaesibacter sp.]